MLDWARAFGSAILIGGGLFLFLLAVEHGARWAFWQWRLSIWRRHQAERERVRQSMAGWFVEGGSDVDLSGAHRGDSLRRG
jgi:hypothetical protein